VSILFDLIKDIKGAIFLMQIMQQQEIKNKETLTNKNIIQRLSALT